MFPKKPRFFVDKDGNYKYDKYVSKYVEDPSSVYSLKGMKPKYTKEIKNLITFT